MKIFSHKHAVNCVYYKYTNTCFSMFILYVCVCIYIAGRIFILFICNLKKMFCFYCQRYFSLSHSKKVAKPLCSFAPGTLGCWMESRCCQRTALFLSFSFFGLGLEVYTRCGDPITQDGKDRWRLQRVPDAGVETELAIDKQFLRWAWGSGFGWFPKKVSQVPFEWIASGL